MHFKSLPVLSLEDATVNFEQLQPLQPATGSATITWTASATATVTIAHGLGHTPTWLSLSLMLLGQAAYVQATGITSTTIAVSGQAAGAFSGSGTVYWAAT